MITIKSPAEQQSMREAGKIIGQLFERIASVIKDGVTTAELDQVAEKHILSSGGKPGFKGYHGFPASICASVNDEVVHGIPNKRVLKEGDIVGVDVGVIINGFFADAARTFCVGVVSDEVKRLLDVTQASLKAGIDAAKPGNRISDISHAVEEVIKPSGYGIVRQYVGHGIGRNLHEEPQIPNYGKPNRGPEILQGMAFAIEPMVNLGGDDVKTLEDGWTVVTADGKKSAHFENTILIHENGPEIITTHA